MGEILSTAGYTFVTLFAVSVWAMVGTVILQIFGYDSEKFEIREFIFWPAMLVVLAIMKIEEWIDKL